MAEMEEQQVRRMTIDELKARIDSAKPYILADARDVDSYDDAHIPGAIPIPVEDVGRLADNYDRDLDVITYCGSYECQASTMAAKEYLKKGFKHVWDYKGGIQEWVEYGNPVEGNK